MLQAPPESRVDPESLNNFFVRTAAGQMAPIGQFITRTKTNGPESLSRFNLFSSISVNASLADGYSSGDAIEAARLDAAESLPAGYGYELGGLAREEASSGNSIVIIFIICVLFIYLILCALYESLFIPLAVMLSVPFGLAGSFLFAKLFGIENNVYMQVGLIMLIGLLGKTAILLTEYASERRQKGLGIAEAVLSAAVARLRPILNDRSHHDLRDAAPSGGNRGRGEWQHLAERGHNRRNAYRDYSPAICRASALYRIPEHRGAGDAQTE